MEHTIFFLLNVVVVLVLFSFRRVLRMLARDVANCETLLLHSSNILPVSHGKIPRKIQLGNRLPKFQVIDVHTFQPLCSRIWIEKSSLIVFFHFLDFRNWRLEHLTAMFKSWLRHLEGDIYIVLIAKSADQYKDEFPHTEILGTEMGQHIVFGVSRIQDIALTLGITKSPFAIELDDSGVVRRVGMFGTRNGLEHGKGDTFLYLSSNERGVFRCLN